MRLPGTNHDCGPLLELGQIQRQLRLSPAVTEGEATIPLAQIIGTVGRGRDFDGCFQPLHPALRKRIDEIVQASPASLDEPIEVVRVDRAYFVADGHKRVAIARRTDGEFIDARVSHMPSPYALTADVEGEAIERTAREGEFRRHSGLGEAVPHARFALTDISAYGELLIAVQSYSYDRVVSLDHALAPREAARLWYDEKYLPTVASGMEAAGGLLDSITEADVYLTLHRQERASWGGECADPECVADMLLAEQRRAAAAARSPLDRVLNRDPKPRNAPAVLLPMADEIDGR
ncbi:MAG: hypothetical protein M3153_03840 [Chloroflexota bacterium]|nr:hypothetical protein [Chloroflexota bacterium]